MSIEQIPGGVCAPKGFLAAGVHCGVRKNKDKKDVALIFAESDCAAAAVYTKNLVKGAPLLVTKAHLANGRARAVICNSGNANTCNANGVEIADGMCDLVADALSIQPGDVIVASTGVIGQPLSLEPFLSGVPALAKALSKDGNEAAAQAIMTTDTFQKEFAVETTLGGVPCRIGGMAKGSGMIHPNMATLLVFLTTDAAISPAVLQKAISADVQDTFNMITVDGDTSTNDMLCILASGAAGNPEITADSADDHAFCAALHEVTLALCKMIAGDGEGATKLLCCEVSGAKDKQTARVVAKSVVSSSLFKAAMFGADANWGRVLCAVGYSGADVAIDKIGVTFVSAKGALTVCQNGRGVPFSEALAKEILSEKEIAVRVTLGMGECAATAYGCDLTYDYVKINGDYRT